ncbi:hypothetical protein BDA99DRAFT_533378 [Phascolomyces articulosus]|uniref:Reverse transcriptase n=1 Tax=Phascolomyces articulosus TaxID=60185 RepID=A0AAD5K960_9FUNG|nr:hypothetical protein BDA99DRAFT_533378 [Phascolomyces articulosus]
MDTQLLIEHNTRNATSTPNCLNALGLSPTGFTRLLATHIYAQFIRPQMEYGLAIQKTQQKHTKLLENTQSSCLRRIYGSNNQRASTKVMQHLINIPSMKIRVFILQAKFLNRTRWLPEDTLLSSLLPIIDTISTSRFGQLKKTALWKSLPPQTAPYDNKQIKAATKQLLNLEFQETRNGPKSKLVAACRPYLLIDPIVWLQMKYSQRSRLIRWRLGWMPNGGTSAICRNCNDNQHLSRNHVISCFDVHTLLNISYVVPDPISFVLNSLPTKRPTSDSKKRYWKYIWPRLTRLMKEIDRLCHDDDLRENDSDQPLSIKNDFIMWIDQPNTDSAHRSPSTSQYTLTQHSSD